MMWNPQPLQELIAPGILYEQTKLVLFGGPKLGKSVLAQQISFCMALGIPWLGYSLKPSKVLYIQAEISEVLFKNRVEAMGLGQSGISAQAQSNLDFCTIAGFHLDKGAAATELFNALDHYKPNILIIDPKYKFISSPDEPTIIHFTDTIDQCILRFHCAVIIVDHSRKPKMSGQGAIVDMGGFELRGPIIEQWADSIIRLTGDLASDLRILQFELRHAVHPVLPKQIRLDHNKLWFEVV